MSEEIAIKSFINQSRHASPLLWRFGLVMLIGLSICFVLSLIDIRQLAGVSVWEKPSKFFLSLLVQGLTLAWAISLIQKSVRGVKTASWLFVAAAFLEMTYMIWRASRGEASHFNATSTFAAMMYGVMGVGSLMLVSTSAFIGWRVWQQRGGSLMREAAGVGLILGSVLATFAAGVLSAKTSHWIGGDLTDATGLGLFHWSTTGGDLRVAHFIGLHTTQAVPLAAISGKRWVTYMVALITIVATTGTFLQAIAGIPFLRG